MDDLINDFLVESIENLDRLDSELVKLESDPSSQELLSSIFRTIHTIKGSCGFLGFSKLEKVAHAGESLLSLLRDGKISLAPELTSGLLSMVDAIRTMLGAIQSTGQDGEESYPELIEALKRLQQPTVGASAVATSPSPQSNQKPTDFPAPPIASKANPKAGQSDVAKVPPPESSKSVVPAAVRDASNPGEHAGKQDRMESGIKLGGETPGASASSADENANSSTVHDAPRSGNAPAETIRVDVHLLDRLMNLVGELVLTRNQITQVCARQNDPNLTTPAQQLNLLTSELQEEVMKTRMQPISVVFDKFPRVVRDVALGCGKQVMIEMEGKETELDKSLLEAIKDPLTHIVRNSVDHGIEMPDQRIAHGKRPEGHIKLRACHEGGQVLIEISDDGAGIDSARVRNKALERGLITPQQATHMGERELLNLIFLPGFSTAEKITNLSGRGVGMDVVKTNIDRVNGSVDIQSSPGMGTTIKIKIPLTLAIVPALVVVCAGERFAIPQVSLSELVRIEAESGNSKIEFVHGVPVYRLRGRLLPLVYLDQALRLERDPEKTAPQGAATTIVVLQADDRQFGLVVDEIIDTEEIVVKPLGKKLKGVNIFAGATIMGDGRVALIIDVLGLAQRANIVAESRTRSVTAHEQANVVDDKKGNRQVLLLIQLGLKGRMAIPLSLVARLEVFSMASIERSGFQDVMQYRGEIMPLVRVAEILKIVQRERVADEPKTIEVVVYSENGRSVGLVVDRILDIVDENVVIQNPSRREGIKGSMVIQSCVTDLLDIPAVVRAAQANLSEEQLSVEELVSA
jgi:two-component system chemotaxis sensor kinase CheA